MQGIFVNIYQLTKKNKVSFFFFLILLMVGIGFFTSQLELEENITAIIPQDSRIDDINLILNNSKFSDQIILNFSGKDSTNTSPDSLIAYAQKVVGDLEQDTSFIKKIRFKVDDSAFMGVYQFFYDNLPFYLSDSDYVTIKEKLQPQALDATLKKNFKALLSPSGIATRKYIFQDPLSLTPSALKRLEDFQLDDNFMIYKSCIFTKDKKHLLVFIDPTYSSSRTQINRGLVTLLESTIIKTQRFEKLAHVEYYGGTAVAVANAVRIKKDIMLTVTIAVIFLLILFWGFFKKLKVLFLLFVPVILGAGISLSLLSIIEGKISAIALGVGAILVGISIDFSLHLFTHYRSTQSIKRTLKDIGEPVMMSSLTTASAFLCLFIVRSQALQQLGMFAAFSVLSASILVLTVIPFFLSKKKETDQVSEIPSTFLDKIAAYPFHTKKYLLLGLVALSVVFFFTSKKLGFEGDISGLNYMPKYLKTAEEHIKYISSEALSAVYIITTGATIDEALEKTEAKIDLLQKCEQDGLLSSMSSASDLILSQKEQKKKLDRWNMFWDDFGRDTLEHRLTTIGARYHFKKGAFSKFINLVENRHQTKAIEEFSVLKDLFLSNYINQADSVCSAISILKVDRQNKKELFSRFEKHPELIIFDKQYFANKFFDVLKDDFNKLVTISMIIVFAILLVFFGRIELAIITYLPITLSWLWTVGLMGLFGIKFNIFNIIISTFIFGLGIDYSIFVMRGLLNNYKYGNREIISYKLSILLSVITTIAGIGVLIFAKHPALRSIATVSVFGITSVVMITYTILPLLFNFLVKHKGNRRVSPIVMVDAIVSIIAFTVFLMSVIILSLLIPVFYIVPLTKKTKKSTYHYLLYLACNLVIKINFTFKRELIDKHKFDL